MASPEYAAFQTALTETCQALSQELVHDGEGATKFVSITVKVGGRCLDVRCRWLTNPSMQGATAYELAKTVASTIATSALVKTALFGQGAEPAAR